MAKWKKIASLALAASCALSLCACGGASDGKTHVVFCTHGDSSELAIFKTMVDEFNRTYGDEHNIFVDNTPIAETGYDPYITNNSMSNSDTYDVFIVSDDHFKKWVNMNFVADMTEYFNAVTDIDTSDIFETAVNRLRLDKSRNTSNPTDPLYGLPLNIKPTALYYNETMFEKAGITVISVDAENMDDWNEGKIPDLRGKYKSDYPRLANITVPKKGYFRSLYPYTPETEWQLPAKDEIMVFNNRIPMNWDELEDLSMIFSISTNPNAKKNFKSTYGLFTEWWFNYGWSVGGDCLQDLSGNGDWNFSLLDSTSNYIVTGESYTGAYTGKNYIKGETLSFNDKFDVPQGKVMQPDEEGGYTVDGNAVGIRSSVSEAVQNGVLYELPSVRDAFTRYLRLGASESSIIEGEGGLDISPNPNTFNKRTRQNYWLSQEIAMLVDYSQYIEIFSSEADFEWDVAPLAVYKEYTNPLNPYDDTTKVVGKNAGMCDAVSMLVRERSRVKQEAAQFIKWMASKHGQGVRAANGHLPNQEELLGSIVYNGYAPKNVKVFAESMAYQGAGDWWYLPDTAWIEVWAVPLNTYVRNGEMSYNTWKQDIIKTANTKLLEY